MYLKNWDMRSNYKLLGKYIRQVDNRNKDLKVDLLLGVSIKKKFMPSIANIVGTNMRTYKIIEQKQFAYGPVTSRNGDKISVSLLENHDQAIVSQAYTVFEIIDHNKLDPEYLMMWFRRSEFDRYARFKSHGSAREVFDWEEMCKVELPVPSIEKQREIVKEYNIISNRIKLNETLNQKLEETAQTIYKHWFVDFEFPISKEYAEEIGRPELEGKQYKSSGGEMVYCEELDQEIPRGWNIIPVEKIISVKDGTHDSPKPSEEGFPLITSTHLQPYEVKLNDAYKISEEDYHQINKRSKVHKQDILFSMIGTVGNITYILYDEISFAIKNVGLFKASENKEIAEYLLCFLKSPITKKYIDTCLLGSTQSYITLTDLRNIPILLPLAFLIQAFQKLICKSIKMSELRVKENNLNRELLDTILSKMTKLS